jgi:hypothetical protein
MLLGLNKRKDDEIYIHIHYKIGYIDKLAILDIHGRSQWPRGLRHEPSSPDRTLGMWVRIPLKTWMSVCVYSVFLLFCV